MSKALFWIVVIVAALAGLGYVGRAYATRVMSSRAVTPKTLGSATPATAGLPFSRVAVETGDRTLIGWWVRARADSGKTAPAVLFLHGNRSSISDYVDFQKFLYRQGVSSFVFDYSGFGASGGAPSLINAIADAGSVARAFADSAGKDARRIALGSALGSTVLLQAIDSVQPYVNGVVIEGVDASVKESAVRSGRLPKFVAPLLEEIGDNVSAAARVRVPLLAVHSYADPRTPLEDAQKVVDAVPARATLVRHWRKGHSALLASSRPCDWAPVLSFVRGGELPSTKFDSTNACAVEAAQLAAAQQAAAKADSARVAASKAAVTPAITPPGRTATKAGVAKAPATKAPATKAPATKASATKAPTTKAGTTKSPQTKSTGTKVGTKTKTTPPATKRP